VTPDPVSAALDQLAACSESIAGIDAREAVHYGELGGQVSELAGIVTTISRAPAETPPPSPASTTSTARWPPSPGISPGRTFVLGR
jgi:hypothetical protein